MSPDRFHETEATETIFFMLAAMAYTNNKTGMEHASINVAQKMVERYLPFEVFFKISEGMETMIKQGADEMGVDPLDMCADPGVKQGELKLELEYQQTH